MPGVKQVVRIILAFFTCFKLYFCLSSKRISIVISFLGYQLFNSLIIISFFDILDLLFSYSYKISSSFC